MNSIQYNEMLKHIDELNTYIEELEKEDRLLKDAVIDLDNQLVNAKERIADLEIMVVSIQKDFERADERAEKLERKLEDESNNK